MSVALGSTNRSEHFANLLALQKTQEPVPKSAEEEFRDTYLDTILQNAVSKLSKVNTFEDFKKVFAGAAKADYYYATDIQEVQDFSRHKEKEDYLSLTDADYKKEFVKYCESRGCYSEDELRALDSTGCATIKQLEASTADVIKKFSQKLVDMGAIDSAFTDEESQQLASIASYKEMAFLNNPDKTFIEKVGCLDRFIKRVLTDEDIGKYIDKKLRDKLADMPNALDLLTKKMEEEESKQRELEKVRANLKPDLKEQNPQDSFENIQKYKASLIAMYAA